MKKVVLVIALTMCHLIVSAQDIINYFEVASNIAKPVTMKTAKGTYKIYGGERIDGNLGWVEAYDANGNWIVNNTPYKTEIGSNKATIRHYRFQTLYNSSSSSSKSNNRSTSSSTGSEIGRKLGNAVGIGMTMDLEGFPNLQVRGGWALKYGEYVAFKAELGGFAGLVLAGGYGPNWFKERDTHALFGDLGMYFAGDEDGFDVYSFGFHYEQTNNSDAMFGFMFEYSHHFEDLPRIGYYLNVCFGINPADALVFNIGAGVSFKLLSK